MSGFLVPLSLGIGGGVLALVLVWLVGSRQTRLVRIVAPFLSLGAFLMAFSGGCRPWPRERAEVACRMPDGAVWLFWPGDEWRFAEYRLGKTRVLRKGQVDKGTLRCDPAALGLEATARVSLGELVNGEIERVDLERSGDAIELAVHHDALATYYSQYRADATGVRDLRGSIRMVNIVSAAAVLLSVLAVAITLTLALWSPRGSRPSPST